MEEITGTLEAARYLGDDALAIHSSGWIPMGKLMGKQ